jgi:hypothetical protein
VEPAVLPAVEAEEPPQAARAADAPMMPAAFRKERREITFFMVRSPSSLVYMLRFSLSF